MFGGHHTCKQRRRSGRSTLGLHIRQTRVDFDQARLRFVSRVLEPFVVAFAIKLCKFRVQCSLLLE